MKPVRAAKCRHCKRDILWATLQNGHNRTFEPEPQLTRDTPSAERYAWSRRYRAVVCLDGEPNPPARVHVPHYCAEYAEAKLMRGTDALGAVDLPFLNSTDPETP